MACPSTASTKQPKLWKSLSKWKCLKLGKQIADYYEKPILNGDFISLKTCPMTEVQLFFDTGFQQQSKLAQYSIFNSTYMVVKENTQSSQYIHFFCFGIKLGLEYDCIDTWFKRFLSVYIITPILTFPHSMFCQNYKYQ